jgi:predicted metal-dependent hydrolase
VPLLLSGIRIDIVRKDIKNVHLSVHPPAGRVRIAAPRHLSDGAIRSFAIRKLGWIRRQQARLQEQERETPREFLDRESHFVWGRRLLLSVVEGNGAPRVELSPRYLTLHVHPRTPPSKRARLLDEWYRAQIRAALPPLISRWASVTDLTVRRVFLQRMKTKWGSCNRRAGTIRLNTELARKPPECLEYLVVHELAHMLEPTHNPRFVALMDRFLPAWQSVRQALNRLPVRHEDWEY